MGKTEHTGTESQKQAVGFYIRFWEVVKRDGRELFKSISLSSFSRSLRRINSSALCCHLDLKIMSSGQASIEIPPPSTVSRDLLGLFCFVCLVVLFLFLLTIRVWVLELPS